MYLRALQDTMNNSTDTTNPLVETEESSVDYSYEFSFVSTLVAVLFLLLLIREFYVRRYGVDFCPVFHLFPSINSNSSSRQSQVDQDRAYAQEVQRQLDLENHEAELEQKRKERREWYESFIVPYTMTVKESDFFYAQETDEHGNTILEQGQVTPTGRKYSSSGSFADVEELVEESSEIDDDDDSTRLYLRLPVKEKDGHCRSVEATCTICFSEYEQGDRVVWSELKCKHAFHYDCIMPWLIKGKKRCPICRDWFVPGARIEDQKKALAERLARENTLSTITDGSDNANGREDQLQGSLDSEAEVVVSSDDCCDTNDDHGNHLCCNHSECQKNVADLENQRKFDKQLSSSEADDDEAQSNSFLGTTTEMETNSNHSSASEAVATTDLEYTYPVTTTVSLTASEPLPIIDDDRPDPGHHEDQEEDSRTRMEQQQNDSSYRPQMDDFLLDELSASHLSETKEMSA